MRNRHRVLLFCLIAVSLFSCKNRTDKQEFDEELSEEYPAIVISDSLSGNISMKLYTLKADFVQRFLAVANDYQGTQVIMRTQMPSDWGLVGIERLPQGRELWLLQSVNREWTYLVITSGSGTQRILDVAPIGIDLACDEGKTLEREVWTWIRDDDGAFVVEKNYEWKKSIVDATQANASDYVKTNYAKDRYIIGEMGRFECSQEANDTLPYKAVVLYRDPQMVVEDWEDKSEMIEAFCEDCGVYYANVSQNYNAVLIQDYTLNDVVTLDITPQMEKSDSVGMLLYQNGKEPKFVKFRSVEYLQMEIRKYFK